MEKSCQMPCQCPLNRKSDSTCTVDCPGYIWDTKTPPSTVSLKKILKSGKISAPDLLRMNRSQRRNIEASFKKK